MGECSSNTYEISAKYRSDVYEVAMTIVSERMKEPKLVQAY